MFLFLGDHVGPREPEDQIHRVLMRKINLWAKSITTTLLA